MIHPEAALEKLEEIMDELSARDPDVVILVEGIRDRGALNLLGVYGEIWQVQGQGTLFSVGERLASESKRAVVLTDWDRTGGQIARRLRESMDANQVPYDIEYRRRIVMLVRTEVKDVQSLPALYSRLVANVHRQRGTPIRMPRKNRAEDRP